MQGRKVLGFGAAIALTFGALAGFAGCDREITDPETRLKVIDAIGAASPTRYEMTARQSVKSESAEGKETKTTAASSEVRISYCEAEDGGKFVDHFTQNENETRVVSPSRESTEKTTGFAMYFYRDGDAYRFSDSWKGVNLKSGNFDGMIKKLKAGGEDHLNSYDYSFSDGLDGDTFKSYAVTLEALDGTVKKTAGGYAAEIDAVKGMKALLAKTETAVSAYGNNPSMTAREFFDDVFVEKLIDASLKNIGSSAGCDAFTEMMREGTGVTLSATVSAENGADAFYACLESEELYTELTTLAAGGNSADLASADGTVGGMKASAVLGPAAEVKAEIRKAQKNTEKFLLEQTGAINGGERDEGSLKSKIEITLDGDFAVTGVRTSSKVTAKDYKYTGDETDSYQFQSTSEETTVRILKDELKLTDLTGIKVDTGMRVKAGTYTLTAANVSLNGHDSDYQSASWNGTASCTVTVGESGIAVAASFVGDGLNASETRTYEYGTSSYIFDYEDLFGNVSHDGKDYTTYGLSYHFAWYSFGECSVTLGSYSNELALPAERVFITL